MDYTKFTEDGAKNAVELIKFDEQIYWISALVDALRDGTKELMELDVADAEGATLQTELINRYASLRDRAMDLLEQAERDQIATWTRKLPDDATAADIYDAAANLARCLDIVIGLPVFIASRVNARNEIRGVMTRAYADQPAAPAAPARGTHDQGHYL